MFRNLDIDELWTAACKRAEAALDDHAETPLPGLPRACPFTLDELASERFDIAAAVARIRAASGRPA